MNAWGQKRARRNVRDAAQRLAHSRAGTEDFERVLGAVRSSIARSLTPDEEKPPSVASPR
jgi:hypothetical protein